jgi:hypothetical protein
MIRKVGTGFPKDHAQTNKQFKKPSTSRNNVKQNTYRRE